MMAAGAILKSLYPKLFCVTCMAHLLRICAMKVKSRYENVVQLIADVKEKTVKNKARQAIVATIGCPFQPVVSGG